jgi:hypothetical protein
MQNQWNQDYRLNFQRSDICDQEFLEWDLISPNKEGTQEEEREL